MEGAVGYILDILLLMLLGVTIMYAVRLSGHLKSIRAARTDFEKIIQTLSTDIVRAENAVRSLNESAAQYGGALQDNIDQAKLLSDELRFMNEAGDNLATRLERLAEMARSPVSQATGAGTGGVAEGGGGAFKDVRRSAEAEAEAEAKAGGFPAGADPDDSDAGDAADAFEKELEEEYLGASLRELDRRLDDTGQEFEWPESGRQGPEEPGSERWGLDRVDFDEDLGERDPDEQDLGGADPDERDLGGAGLDEDSFVIRDPEFEQGETGRSAGARISGRGREGGGENMSLAERDLYQALGRSARVGAGKKRAAARNLEEA